MFGAIIGDLAAWTYLRDKEEFFSRLIGNRAKVSELTITILWVAKKTSNRMRLEDNHLLNQFQDWLIKSQQIDGVKLSEDVNQWIYHPNMKMHNLDTGLFLMCQGAYSYWYDCDSSKCDLIDYGMNQEEEQASIFLSKILTFLRLGWTKDEVRKKLGVGFEEVYKGTIWLTEIGGVLNYIMRAWSCFYKSYDFVSAILNAVNMIGDTRINCALTGMVAETMYGCSKHLESGCSLTIPKTIKEAYSKEFRIIWEQLNWVNVFRAKNDTPTTIKRQCYTKIESLYENKRISAETHRRIIKSRDPYWDNKFCFYKENGWIYLCYPGTILGRFRFHYDNGDFIFKDIQGTSLFKNIDNQICAVLWEIDMEWAKLQSLFRFYSCYQNPKTCPNIYKGTIAENIWEGEKIFYDTQMDNLGKWIREGKKTVETSNSPKLISLAKKIGPERFGVVYYIKTLYDKSNNCDNMDWLLDH